MKVRALFPFGLTAAVVIAGVPLTAQAATAVAPAPGSAQSATVAKDAGPDVHVAAAVERRLAGGTKGDPARVPVIVSFETSTRDGGTPSVAAVRTARSTVVASMPAGSYDLVSSFSRIPAVSLEIDAAGLAALRRNPLVTAVDADQVISTTMTEANPLTGVAALHSAGVTGDGVTVGVIDTGVDSTGGVVHPALADDVVGQACFRTEADCIGGVTSAEDQDGHGTHVAGIITGPQGVAPDATIYALKVFTTADTSDTNILNALNHVIGLNTSTPGTVDVINMSLGGGNFGDRASCDANSTAYVTAFATLNGQGVPVFVATGNDGRIDQVSSPGCATGAIGVGSVGDATFSTTFSNCIDNAAADRVSCFSNATPVQGADELVDLLAPGCQITSTGLDGVTNDVKCGTSMATPYAAGSGALVMEYLAAEGLTRTPAQLEELLEGTGVAISDYRMPAGAPTFPRVNPVGAIGSLAVAPPGGLSILSSTSDSVALQWGAVAAATQYRVYVSLDGSPAAVGTVPAGTTTFTDTPTACGPLSYTVRAFDGTFESLPSNPVAITTRACPAAPTGLVLSVTGSTSHDLSWSDPNADETSVVLQRSVGGAEFIDLQTFPAGSSFQRTESALSCGMHRYRAIAVRDGDRSAPSNTVSRSICAPTNDDIAAAEVVTPGAVGTTVTDTEPNASHATSEPTDPIFSCRFGGAAAGYNSVWYRVTPATDTRVTISTAATTVFAPTATAPDTLVAVHTGTPASLTEYGCNDDISGTDFRSTLVRNLRAGTTYWVQVSQWTELPAGTVGNLVTAFTWADPIVVPANDLVADATGITAVPFTGTVTNAQNATTSATDPLHECAVGSGTTIVPRVGTHTLWWTYTPEFDGTIDLDTLASSGSFTDTILSVLAGPAGTPTTVACNDDQQAPGTSLRSQLVDVPVSGGTTYRIYVSRWSTTPTTTAGTVVLNLAYQASPGATVSPTGVQVSEDGGVATYTVRLHAQPNADVVVTPVGDADCTVAPAALTFTAADYATAQTVEVSAVADGDVEGDHSCAITHTATSADAGYAGLAIADVTGAVTDALRTGVTLTTPADGASVAQGATVAADFACTDNRNGAGITSCVGTVADGSPIDTSTAGQKSFTVTLVDVLGRTTAVTHTYTVTPPPAGPPAGPTPPPAGPPAGPTPPTARPDARIGKGPRGKLVGNNVFNTAVGQTKKATVRGSQRARFRVSLQNDGPVADRLRVTGGASANGFVVRYTKSNGTDITAAVVQGRFQTPSLRPGATYTVLVTVRRGARVGSSLSGTVTADSVAQTGQTDAVTFVTTRRR